MRLDIKGVGTVTFRTKADFDANRNEGVEHKMTAAQFDAVQTELFHHLATIQGPNGPTTPSNPVSPTNPVTPTPTGPGVHHTGVGPWHIIQGVWAVSGGGIEAIVLGIPDEVLKD